MPINLTNLGRPNTASIFATDPTSQFNDAAGGLGRILVFVLTNVAIPIPNRVRLDLTHNVGTSKRSTPARSPLVRSVIDNIQLEPETVSLSGSLSATPLGLAATRLGGFGSAIRRDLKEVSKLRRIMDRREPVTLVLPARVYRSMCIVSLDETHDGSNKVELSMSFEEVRIVSPISVSGALDLDELQTGAGSTTNAGAQPVQTVNADVGGGLG